MTVPGQQDKNDVDGSPKQPRTVAGITVEEFLSTFAGKPSTETLAKIRVALADPNSEIHSFLRTFADYFTRGTDPGATNWAACVSQSSGSWRDCHTGERSDSGPG